jgi:hypothetical protein
MPAGVCVCSPAGLQVPRAHGGGQAPAPQNPPTRHPPISTARFWLALVLAFSACSCSPRAASSPRSRSTSTFSPARAAESGATCAREHRLLEGGALRWQLNRKGG